MSKTIICSLNIRNKNRVVRQVGTGILGPNQSGLFHFKSIAQVNHAILLEKSNQISILSPIPSYILLQLQGRAIPEAEGTLTVDSVTNVETGKTVKLEKGKPSFYLSWDEVESKSKPELQEWFEKNPAEGLSLPKNKNAAATKEIIHAFLAGQFEDHIAPVEEFVPVEETSVEVEEQASSEE